MISISKHHNASTDSWIKLESGVYAVIAQDFLIWYGESSALVQIYSAMVREGNFHVLLCRLCVFQDPPQISFCMRCVLISWPPQHPWTVTVSAVYCSLLEFCYFWVKSRAKRAGVAARRTVAVFAVSCSILQFCYFLVKRVLTVQVLLAAAHLFLSDIRRLFIHEIEVASTVTQGKDLAQAKGMFWEFRCFSAFLSCVEL